MHAINYNCQTNTQKGSKNCLKYYEMAKNTLQNKFLQIKNRLILKKVIKNNKINIRQDKLT